MKFFTIFIILSSFSVKSYSISCKSLLSGQNNSPVEMLLAPLNIETLVSNANLAIAADPKTLDPRLDVIAYTMSDTALTSDLGLPVETFRIRDRIVETDYGYAILDVDELRDWTLLQSVIADPQRAEEFINKVANSKGSYPRGITKEAAEWLRWSVFAKQESVRKSGELLPKKPFEDMANPLEIGIKILKFQRAELRRLIRQKEIFIFPFGIDARGSFNLMEADDAQVVLAILARQFILSKLYVKRPNGEYIKLAEFLDRESLLLISRYPELLASYPVFEGGQVTMELENSLVGRTDTYNIASRSLLVNDPNLYDLDFKAVVSGSGKDVYLDASVTFYFDYDSLSVRTLRGSDYKRIFSLEIDKVNTLLMKKAKLFSEITGYTLPSITVIEDKTSETLHREYQVSFGDTEVPAHIKSAFYVFLALHN